MSKYCVQCGKTLNDDDIFCEKCGTKQEIIEAAPLGTIDSSKRCIKCGNKLEDDGLFCGVCGAKQEVEQAHIEYEDVQKAVIPKKQCIKCGCSLDDDDMFCIRCGAKLNEEDEFCWDCGSNGNSATKNTVDGAASTLSVNKASTHEQSTIKEKKSKAWIWIVATVAVCIIAIVAVLLWKSGTNKPSETNDPGPSVENAEPTIESTSNVKYEILGKSCSAFITSFEKMGGSVLDGFDSSSVMIGKTDNERRKGWEKWLYGFDTALANDCQIYMLENTKQDDYVALLVFAENDIITSYYVQWSDLNVDISHYLDKAEFSEIASLNANSDPTIGKMLGLNINGESWNDQFDCRLTFLTQDYNVQFQAVKVDIKTGEELSSWHNMSFFRYYVQQNSTATGSPNENEFQQEDPAQQEIETRQISAEGTFVHTAADIGYYHIRLTEPISFNGEKYSIVAFSNDFYDGYFESKYDNQSVAVDGKAYALEEYEVLVLTYLNNIQISSATKSTSSVDYASLETTGSSTMKQYEGIEDTWGCFRVYDITSESEVYFEVDWYRATGFGGVAKLNDGIATFDIQYGETKLKGYFTISDDAVALNLEESTLMVGSGVYKYNYNTGVYRDSTLAGYGTLDHNLFISYLEKNNKSSDITWEFLGSPGEIFFVTGAEYPGFFDLYKVTAANGAETYYACSPYDYQAEYGVYQIGLNGTLQFVWIP